MKKILTVFILISILFIGCENPNVDNLNESTYELSTGGHSLLRPYLYGKVCNSYFSNNVPFLLPSSRFPKNVDVEDLTEQKDIFRAMGEDFLRREIYNYDRNQGLPKGAAGSGYWSSGSFEQYYLNQWTFTGWAEFKEGNPVVSKYLIVTYSVSVEYR